jgi:hypothetical protein
MAIVETNLPLADILIETGFGIVAMNAALAPNGVGATHATVGIRFMASLQRGFDYSRTNHSGGAVFTFWLIGGAGAASYTRTDLHVYNQYSENIRIDISITFEPLPEVA